MGGDYAALRSRSGVVRLGHGAKGGPYSGAFACRDAQGVAYGFRIQTVQFRCRRSRAEYAYGACGVKAVLIVVWLDCLGHFASYLDAAGIGRQQVAAAGVNLLRNRDRCGKDGGSRVGQQSVNPVRQRRNLRVVEVQRVAAHAVG